MPSVLLDGRAISYTLLESQRARTWRLEVGAGTGLRVIVPQQFHAERIPSLLQARRRWILRTLEWAAALPPPLAHDGYGRGQHVLYHGESLALEVWMDPLRPSAVIVRDGALVVRVRRRDGMLVRRALRRWLRERAAELIPSRVAEVARQLGVPYRVATLGDQQTRWGSCSRAGRLRFNWRLILAPPAILDYVITHELAHVRHLNHSKQFWSLVAAWCPDYAAHRAWLRRHGRELAV